MGHDGVCLVTLTTVLVCCRWVDRLVGGRGHLRLGWCGPPSPRTRPSRGRHTARSVRLEREMADACDKYSKVCASTFSVRSRGLLIDIPPRAGGSAGASASTVSGGAGASP